MFHFPPFRRSDSAAREQRKGGGRACGANAARRAGCLLRTGVLIAANVSHHRLFIRLAKVF